MSLRTLPLRLKLAIALVLPMLLVTILIGDRVSNSFNERGVATAQQDEAARLEAVAAFADAVGAESVVTNDPTATRDQLTAARLLSDTARQQLDDPMTDIDAEVLRRINVRYNALLSIRETVGDRPSDISLRFQLEAYVDPQVDFSDPSTMGERVPSALGRLSRLPTDIAGEFEFASDAVVDVETAKLLNDYQLVQRLRDNHVQEVSVLLQLAATPPSLIDDTVLDVYRERVVETDVSRSLIFEYADQELITQIAASRRSIAGAEYARLRTDAERSGPGIARMSDTAAVNRSGSVVTSQYAQLSNDVVDAIKSQAEDTTGAATTSLVLVLLAGAWMLVIAILVLGMLYRAIRAPLRRLTEQSQHIANVELPYVVAAMRGGDLEEAPQTTDLVADADDEIGDLVHAFNDMHRTAVELAAEQAGSRRVVADMFVNLGRRNQRLVNRLLKRLTVLERDERDPDKLAGLYEIDHVVTRMRRNAESLLVLAGASQSRKWDRPVEVYDIAQAALSEVEGYERVEIIAGDDFQVHGDVVADLTHLLAEVVENAVSFSPPSAPVDVSIRRIGDDHLVSVSDLGVGMNDAQLAAANDRIWRAGTEDETPSEFLGHYVIGRLAARHGIDVRLSTGLGGRGIVADVLVPVGAVVPAAGELVDGFDEADESLGADASAAEPVAPSNVVTAEPPVRSATLPEHQTAATAAAETVEVERPDWGSVTHEVRRPAAATAAEAEVSEVAEPAMAETFGEQSRRVPAAGQPAPVAPTAAPPAPAPVVAPAPAPVRAPAASPEPAIAAVAPASASPPPVNPRLEATSSLAQLATPPGRSSFDYPPADQIDPRQRESAHRPAATPAVAPTAPAPGLDAARNSANDAVEGALTAFGSARRTPGAALPDTSLTAAISGHMTLDLDRSPPVPSEPAAPAAPATAPLTEPTPDPNEIRFQLSGFQSGTSRADREN